MFLIYSEISYVEETGQKWWDMLFEKSNSFYENNKIAVKDISKYFDDGIISSNVGYEKPRIELFQYALSVAHFPNRCYMIGDNPVADIIDGKSTE